MAVEQITKEDVREALDGKSVQLSLVGFDEATLYAAQGKVNLTGTPIRDTLKGETPQGEGRA